MIDTIRPKRPASLAPSIREVCLVGSPRRTYVHREPGGTTARASGPKPAMVGPRGAGQVAS